MLPLHRSVRANAAWVVGNAVKNDAGFQLWVAEGTPGPTRGLPGDSTLSRLLAVLEEDIPGSTTAGVSGGYSCFCWIYLPLEGLSI
jgi:hypothetical protein